MNQPASRIDPPVQPDDVTRKRMSSGERHIALLGKVIVGTVLFQAHGAYPRQLVAGTPFDADGTVYGNTLAVDNRRSGKFDLQGDSHSARRERVAFRQPPCPFRSGLL